MTKANKRRRKKEARQARLEQEKRELQARRRRRLAINIAFLIAVFAIVGFVVNRTREQREATPEGSPTPSPAPAAVACGGEEVEAEEKPTFEEEPPMTIDQSKTYRAVMETSCGTIVIELADDEAPQTVNSFVFLARQGFFDGLIFHRIVEGFALQGGDPNGDGSGGPGYQVVEAPPEGISYAEGTVAMAKAGADPPGASGSQFFIVPGGEAESLPPEFALLGRVVEGQEAVEMIEAVPTEAGGSGEESQPLETVYIVRVTIEES